MTLPRRAARAHELSGLEPQEFHAQAFDRLRELLRNDKELPYVRSAAYEALLQLVRIRELAEARG